MKRCALSLIPLLLAMSVSQGVFAQQLHNEVVNEHVNEVELHESHPVEDEVIDEHQKRCNCSQDGQCVQQQPDLIGSTFGWFHNCLRQKTCMYAYIGGGVMYS